MHPEILKTLRENKGFTQKQMAKMLGYKDKSSICLIEKGKVKITLDLAIKICSILEIDIKELLIKEKIAI